MSDTASSERCSKQVARHIDKSETTFPDDIQRKAHRPSDVTKQCKGLHPQIQCNEQVDRSHARISTGQVERSHARISTGQEDRSHARISTGQEDQSHSRISTDQVERSHTEIHDTGQVDKSHARISTGQVDRSHARIQDARQMDRSHARIHDARQVDRSHSRMYDTSQIYKSHAKIHDTGQVHRSQTKMKDYSNRKSIYRNSKSDREQVVKPKTEAANDATSKTTLKILKHVSEQTIQSRSTINEKKEWQSSKPDTEQKFKQETQVRDNAQCKIQSSLPIIEQIVKSDTKPKLNWSERRQTSLKPDKDQINEPKKELKYSTQSERICKTTSFFTEQSVEPETHVTDNTECDIQSSKSSKDQLVKPKTLVTDNTPCYIQSSKSSKDQLVKPKTLVTDNKECDIQSFKSSKDQLVKPKTLVTDNTPCDLQSSKSSKDQLFEPKALIRDNLQSSCVDQETETGRTSAQCVTGLHLMLDTVLAPNELATEGILSEENHVQCLSEDSPGTHSMAYKDDVTQKTVGDNGSVHSVSVTEIENKLSLSSDTKPEKMILSEEKNTNGKFVTKKKTEEDNIDTECTYPLCFYNSSFPQDKVVESKSSGHKLSFKEGNGQWASLYEFLSISHNADTAAVSLSDLVKEETLRTDDFLLEMEADAENTANEDEAQLMVSVAFLNGIPNNVQDASVLKNGSRSIRSIDNSVCTGQYAIGSKHSLPKDSIPTKNTSCMNSNKDAGENMTFSEKSESEIGVKVNKIGGGNDKTQSGSDDKNRKKKSVDVYVRFTSALGPNIDIEGYLRNRLNTDISFIFQKKHLIPETESTICTLACPSKRVASRLKNYLHSGNQKSKTKLQCFDDFEVALSTATRSEREIQEILLHHVEQISYRADRLLTEHENKLRECTIRLEEIRSRSNKFDSIEAFQARDIEKRNIIAKREEMELQQKEFKLYLAALHAKLQEFKHSRHLDRSLEMLRHDFGVECTKLSSALPMYARRSAILDVVKTSQVSVIIGETGSGKSTQMAQYLYQAGLANDGMIVCTQPRKVAAVNIATHVAREMGTSVGQLIGYRVGMQSKTNAATKIVYMTDHTLLNECLKDRKLKEFSCIIIDEAHERSIYTDLLLGMIKDCLKYRPDLHVVITSATIDPDVFVRYFGDCPVLMVSGRTYPVDVDWKEQSIAMESFNSHLDDAVTKAVEIHLSEPYGGDILVFLTSPFETEKACEKFSSKIRERDCVCLPLHGKLQANDQQKVFEPPKQNIRKIVFATNCAETSVTIPGIRYVIDTGLVKEMQFDAKRKMHTLTVTTITKSSAEQRKGRAGRTGPGKCFRLYTEDEYDEMRQNSVPEILKIHVGHAMLKLMELEIDPMEFDFVMSPSVESMEEAIYSLERIGAVAKRKITDLGKWIAKFPLDPKHGAFVHEALGQGVGLEAIVIAAAAGSGSVFYREGNDEQKDLSDKRKAQFCHDDGDHLTILNVFRAWHRVPEKRKGKWCFDNSVNGKSMKGIRDTVNEVLSILRKEMKTNIKFELGLPKDVDKKLKTLLIRSLTDNMSCFLGHSKAGYHLISKEHRIEIHPSSSLKLLGSRPEWIVFDSVMQTTKNFAMTVTFVTEQTVLEGIENGWLHFNIDEVKAKRIVPICTEFVGTQMFRDFVGPRYSNVHMLESNLAALYPRSIVVVEANRDTNELSVYSYECNKPSMKNTLKEKLTEIADKFKLEENEERIGSKPLDGSVRAVVGAGGNTVTVYMPDEFKTVKIHCAVNKVKETTREDIEEVFSTYGTIRECKRYNLKQKSSLWGHVTFSKTDDAIDAVKDTKGNVDMAARPNVKQLFTTRDFKAKIQWCRRPSRGFGFVDFTEVEDAINAGTRSMHIGGSIVRIKPSKGNSNSVHIGGLNPLVTEDVLRQSVAEGLQLDATTDIKRVTVVREKVTTTKDQIQTFKRRIQKQIERFVAPRKFTLEIREPRDFDINFTCFCRFDSPEDGHEACMNLNYGFAIQNESVSMKADLHCSIYIRSNIFAKCGDEVLTCIEMLEKDSKAIKLKWKRLRNENVVVDLDAENADVLADARNVIQDIIRGDVLELENNHFAKSLFTRDGRTFLQSVKVKTNTEIVVDNRVMTIAIHGSESGKAITMINSFIEKTSKDNFKEISLIGNGNPPGFMKALLLKYGVHLQRFKAEANLSSVKLDPKNHRLRISGSEEAIATGLTLVNEVFATLSLCSTVDNEDIGPECVICFTPIEQHDVYRLECCGHPYCKDCIQLQTDSAITSKDFPIQCGYDGCSLPFVWKDLFTLYKKGILKLSKLTSSSVSAFVSQHKKEFHYCITPDCPVVYRVTETGELFVCPECEFRICTQCHIQYHEGLSCAMYNSKKKDGGSIKMWMMKDRENRKFCPHCTTAIEKTEGCQHMTCGGCKKHLCWICLEVFNDSNSCYGHLQNKHGSFI